MRFIALLFFVFNSFNILYCQVVDSLFENIDEIVISQNRIHLALKDNTRQIQVISKKQIMVMPATSLPELLQHISGIDIRRRGINSTQADINIQGGSFEQVLILLNGVRMTDAQTGHHNMYLPISIQNIERIEIVKGAASALYGSNATGQFSGQRCVMLICHFHADCLTVKEKNMQHMISVAWIG